MTRRIHKIFSSLTDCLENLPVSRRLACAAAHHRYALFSSAANVRMPAHEQCLGCCASLLTTVTTRPIFRGAHSMMAVHQTPLSYSVAINLPNLQIGVSVCRSTIIMSFKKCPAVFTTHHRRIMRCTAIRTYRRIFFVYLRTIRFRFTKLYPSIVVKQIHLLGFLFIHDLSIEEVWN